MLSRRAEWDVHAEALSDDSPEDGAARLGVRVAVEFDHWSEVLGFGEFALQPNTRLAPFTELAIRAKAPPRPRRSHRAYMADIAVDVEQVEFGSWWHETKREPAARLAPDQDTRGKAQRSVSPSPKSTPAGAGE